MCNLAKMRSAESIPVIVKFPPVSPQTHNDAPDQSGFFLAAKYAALDVTMCGVRLF